jgi:DNA processing protein
MTLDEKRVNELAAIYFFKGIKGLGPVKAKEIFEKSNSFYDYFITLRNSIAHGSLSSYPSYFSNKFYGKFLEQFRKKYLDFTECKNFVLTQIYDAKEFGGRIVTYHDDVYPKNLYETNQAIPLLYAAGDLSILKSKKTAAIVGTRKPCEWTKKNVRIAVKRLVGKGYVIISGLAKGVDSIAHKTALESGGKTVAVLGSGIDVFYPKENRELQTMLKKCGVLISEYPFGMKVQAFSLKKRNKILVGLSNFVLITETSRKGGTMNSYFAAVEQKKPVRVFLPREKVDGNFDGNRQISLEHKTKVTAYSSGFEIW